MATDKAHIGTIETIHRYPVKSMAGEVLEDVFVQYSGVMGDRVWAFVQSEKSGNFPWHSAREQEDLLMYKPRFAKPLDPAIQYPDAKAFATVVRTPAGDEHEIDSPQLMDKLQEKAAHKIHLRFSEKGMQDARPISIFSLETLTALSEELGDSLDQRRFRANFYVSWKEKAPFYEDTLVGRTLRIGDKLELQIVKKDPRCKIITLDPNDASPKPEILTHVAKKHRGCCGVYGAVLREGLVQRGDPILLV